MPASRTRLAFVVERIAASLGEPSLRPPLVATGPQAEHVRAFRDAHLFERVTMASAAAAVGARPTQLAWSFSALFGIPPHAYVLGRRPPSSRSCRIETARLGWRAVELSTKR